jgi:chromatin segregation and condensation protein Rec8/ScpA/Scc1 (kleisin family)
MESVSVAEVVVTFSALLELLKMQYIMISQSDFFGDMDITLNPDFKDEVVFLEEADDYKNNDDEQEV